MSESITPMRVKTLETQAYEWMREKIIIGEWAQGSHLKDNEIAIQLGISATPVREALRKLASEGLVRTIPYRGTFVISYSAIEVEELMNVRLGLELMGLENCRPELVAQELDDMETVIRDFDSALARNDLSALLEADMNFHKLVVHVGRNGVLDELYRQLTGRIQMLMAIADISGRMSTGNEDHKGILHAMQACDVAAAEVALRNHLVITCYAILAHWPEAVQPTSTESPPKE
jgi:DNA-binding GntR family transcriptional regulator